MLDVGFKVYAYSIARGKIFSGKMSRILTGMASRYRRYRQNKVFNEFWGEGVGGQSRTGVELEAKGLLACGQKL